MEMRLREGMRHLREDMRQDTAQLLGEVRDLRQHVDTQVGDLRNRIGRIDGTLDILRQFFWTADAATQHDLPTSSPMTFERTCIGYRDLCGAARHLAHQALRPVRQRGNHLRLRLLRLIQVSGLECAASVTVQGAPAANYPNRHHTQRMPNAYSHPALHMGVGTRDQTDKRILHRQGQDDPIDLVDPLPVYPGLEPPSRRKPTMALSIREARFLLASNRFPSRLRMNLTPSSVTLLLTTTENLLSDS